MKIQELILEGALNVSPADTNYFVRNSSERLAMFFQKAIDTVNAALDADEIINPEYQSIKGTINRAFDETLSNVFNKPFLHAGAWESLPADVYEQLGYLRPELHTIGSVEKKLAKIKSKHPGVDVVKEFVLHAKPIAQAMAYLKTKVVKKVRAAVEKEEKETKYREKIASHADVKLIRETLTQITKNVYDDALKANKKWLRVLAERVIKTCTEHPKDSKMKLFARDPFGYHIAYLIIDYNMSVLPNHLTLLDKEAKKITDDMMEHFINKNTSKLSEIVAKKNNMQTVKLVDASTSRGTVEGTINFEFSDGSSFTVRNKVVMSYSKYNTPFYRYPTTFHNVKMPDGSTMSQPSEERMLDVFTA